MNIKFKEKLAAREVAGELYVVDIEAETLHSLNPPASLIWACLKKGLTAAGTAARLAGEFEVTKEEAEADVEAFIKVLEAKGLVKK